MVMNQRIFPIKQEPACLLKWGWSTVFFQSGTTASCHRTEKYSIDPAKFDEFHNLPEKLTARQLMLDGQWPGHGCEYCKNVETAGHTSDRQFQLDQQRDPGLTPPELLTDPTAVNVTPTILEVYFNNTCNMACVYCGPHFSSLWEDENRKHGIAPQLQGRHKFGVQYSQYNPDYKRMVSDLWKYLDTDQRYLFLRRFHVLGGEPFLQKELDECIAFWNGHANPDVVISIITNLNVPEKQFQDQINQFTKLVEEKKICKFQITASLDGWGPEEEYVRYGLNLDLWEKNFTSLLSNKWITISINSAISALSIKQLPALVKKIKEWNGQRPLGAEPIIFSFNYTDDIASPLIFGKDVFDLDFEKTLEHLDKNTELELGIYQALDSMAKTISGAPRNPTRIENLKNYLDQLDQRRKLNWRTTFPWLDQQFE
jgi:pyruvate-formate lyase-activating enzyme